MPASRILEGSLPERRPKAQIFPGAQPKSKTQPQRDIKGGSPCLVSVHVVFVISCADGRVTGSGAYMHSGMRSDPHVGALRRCSLTETETDLRNEIYEHLP
jgi:hypothetical protein